MEHGYEQDTHVTAAPSCWGKAAPPKTQHRTGDLKGPPHRRTGNQNTPIHTAQGLTSDVNRLRSFSLSVSSDGPSWTLNSRRADSAVDCSPFAFCSASASTSSKGPSASSVCAPLPLPRTLDTCAAQSRLLSHAVTTSRKTSFMVLTTPSSCMPETESIFPRARVTLGLYLTTMVY